MKLPDRGNTQECPLGIEKVCLNKQTLTNIFESPRLVFVFVFVFFFFFFVFDLFNFNFLNFEQRIFKINGVFGYRLFVKN